MHPLYHARSSAKKFGGEPQDYLALHQWFDQTKAHIADNRHRALLHSSFGIFLCEQFFGVSFARASDGKEIAVRPIGEQHVIEDLGFIPSVEQWFVGMPVEPWMSRKGERPPTSPVAQHPMRKEEPDADDGTNQTGSGRPPLGGV